MPKKLLVTNPSFFTADHLAELQSYDYEIVYLDSVQASENELVEAIKDVSVYIIGGIEQTTQPVIDAADKLEAIIFPGVDYDKFVPAADYAKAKGIQIYNAPGANAVAVAEYALGVALLMQRHLVQISRMGDVKNLSTGSIENSVVGIIGAGNIGQKLIEIVAPFHPKEVVFYNRSPLELAARQVELEELVTSADIIFLALPMKAGQILTANLVSQLKKESLLVSISPLNLIDMDALTERVLKGDVRAAIDWPNPIEELKDLPLERWYTVNSHSAYNTNVATEAVATKALEHAKNLFSVR